MLGPVSARGGLGFLGRDAEEDLVVLVDFTCSGDVLALLLFDRRALARALENGEGEISCKPSASQPPSSRSSSGQDPPRQGNDDDRELCHLANGVSISSLGMDEPFVMGLSICRSDGPGENTDVEGVAGGGTSETGTSCSSPFRISTGPVESSLHWSK